MKLSVRRSDRQADANAQNVYASKKQLEQPVRKPSEAPEKVIEIASTCKYAAKTGTGDLDALKWARAQAPALRWDQGVFIAAAQYGHLDVLQRLRSQDPPCPWSAGVCFAAAKNGRLDVLQWAGAQDPPCPSSAGSTWPAAKNGHLDVLQRLRSQDPPCLLHSMPCV